jgi:hypothetical protein
MNADKAARGPSRQRTQPRSVGQTAPRYSATASQDERCGVCGDPIWSGQARYRCPDGVTHVRCHDGEPGD